MDGLFDIRIVSFVFTPLAVMVALLLWLLRNRIKDIRSTLPAMDTPGLLLTIAVRRMPVERREWGAAMLAELAQVRHPSTRWRFALSCIGVALFPPRQGVLLQIIMNNNMKSIGAAALISLILVAPFAYLELRYNTETSRNLIHFPIPVFGLLWFLATVFIVLVASIVRTVRADDSLLAHPVTLLFRLVFLALVACLWGGLFIDQLPCFLGDPNCD